MTKKTKKVFSAFLLFATTFLLSGCGCKQETRPSYNLKLEIWGPLDDSYTYNEILEAYQKANPQIKDIDYKKLTMDSYKEEIVEALASGQGPDIIFIHNSWLPSFQDKMVASPTDIFNEQKYRSNFPDVCVNDFLEEGKVWAAPLSVDSLALYYNKDLFNEAGITSPPKDWDEFIEDVKKLTKVNSNGDIIQSGAALGTSYNINRSTDILSLLVLQSANQKNSDSREIILNNPSALNALNFYTEFARSGSLRYSWNPRMHYSLDAFSEGNLAMMFNYSWHIETIKNKSPKLNFAVAPVPQFTNGAKVNYANYWAMGVTKNKMSTVSNDIRVKEAWKLINFLTTKTESKVTSSAASLGGGVSSDFDPASEYIKKTGKPAARRDLIEAQKKDPVLSVFALDNLIAASWRQARPEDIEGIMAEMIDGINKGQYSSNEALEIALRRIQVFSK